MIIPPQIQRKHGQVQPYIIDVSSRVRDAVATFCDARGYPFAGRLKDGESLAEKIESGRFARWGELDDLYACSVIIPTAAEEADVLAYLRSCFRQVECRARGETQKDPSVFRFDATRFIGALEPRAVPHASAALLGVHFEIQIRTAFEHAWSVTTHALAYKSSRIDWRHLRLAAQLKAVVEQLDQIIVGFEQSASTIVEQSWPEVRTKHAIHEFFEKEIAAGSVPRELAPASWSRFCDNLYNVTRAASRDRGADVAKHVQAALQGVSAELAMLKPGTFPRSVSLLQFCIGALVRNGVLSGPLHRYTPLVTDELLSLFPECSVLGAGFDVESESH